MPEHRIEYRLESGEEMILWANRSGSRIEARSSAMGLLDELRERHGSKARVFIDGKGVRQNDGD